MPLTTTPATQNSCILAMDTATGPCSVALWHHRTVCSYQERANPSMQSAHLVDMVEQALSENKLKYSNLTTIAVTVGPGSFTGIRVALATAKAMGFACDIPVVGYTTLQVLGYATKHEADQTIAVLNAGKGEHYVQLFNNAFNNAPWQEVSEPLLGTLPAVLASLNAPCAVLSGTIAPTTPDALITRYKRSTITFPRADSLAELAALHPELSTPNICPLYIRAPDAKLPTK